MWLNILPLTVELKRELVANWKTKHSQCHTKVRLSAIIYTKASARDGDHGSVIRIFVGLFWALEASNRDPLEDRIRSLKWSSSHLLYFWVSARWQSQRCSPSFYTPFWVLCKCLIVSVSSPSPSPPPPPPLPSPSPSRFIPPIHCWKLLSWGKSRGHPWGP